MQILMRWSICVLCLMLTEGAVASQKAPASIVLSPAAPVEPVMILRLAQTLSPAPQTTQPKQTAPSKQPSVQAKSILPTTEQENKQLKERVAKQEEEIKTLNARLERMTSLSNSHAGQINKLNQQIGEMTKRGGSLVRAYCENDRMSRNMAGASSDCSRAGYQCEPVSGLCRVQCANTAECAIGWVCDVPRCVFVR